MTIVDINYFSCLPVIKIIYCIALVSLVGPKTNQPGRLELINLTSYGALVINVCDNNTKEWRDGMSDE